MSRKNRSAKRRLVRVRRRTQPGAAPGTLIVDPKAPAPQMKVTAFDPKELVERRIESPSQLQEFLGRYPVTWVNVDGLGSAATIREIGEIFGIHRLALEDVVNVNQRAKVETYAEHHYMVLRMALMNHRLETEQVSLFLGKDFVLTFQERPGDCLDPIRERIRHGKGRIRHVGPDYLTYAIIDAIVDGYFPVLETYGDRLEAIEDEVLLGPSRQTILRIHEVKHDLLLLRRAVWPLREAISSLFPDTTPYVEEETRVYLRDCYDHTIRVVELVESYREIASSLTDIYLSSVSNRMNEVMKVLTMMATIFIPMSFVAGLYGMNFQHMPELSWRWGYPLAWLLMGSIAVGQLLFFRRKGWIGSRSVEKPPSPPSAPLNSPDSHSEKKSN